MKLTPVLCLSYLCILGLFGCSPKNRSLADTKQHLPSHTLQVSNDIQRISPEIDSIIDVTATLEVLVDNLHIADGPLWVNSRNALLISEVGRNKLILWSEEEGVRDYLFPSGNDGADKKKTNQGSRGLGWDKEGNLLITQPSEATISIMAASISMPRPHYLPMFQSFLKKEMYGPTDIEVDSKGNLLFTDPAPVGHDFKNKEKWHLPFSGVYAQSRTGRMELLNDELTVPSGLALSIDEKYIVVANGDPNDMYWQRTDITHNLKPSNTGVIYRIPKTESSKPGSPDGLIFHRNGYVFATAPGGVWIFDSEFKLIGKILTPTIATDCTFNTGYTHLYITTQSQLLRMRLQ